MGKITNEELNKKFQDAKSQIIAILMDIRWDEAMTQMMETNQEAENIIKDASKYNSDEYKKKRADLKDKLDGKINLDLLVPQIEGNNGDRLKEMFDKFSKSLTEHYNKYINNYIDAETFISHYNKGYKEIYGELKNVNKSNNIYKCLDRVEKLSSLYDRAETISESARKVVVDFNKQQDDLMNGKNNLDISDICNPQIVNVVDDSVKKLEENVNKSNNDIKEIAKCIGEEINSLTKNAKNFDTIEAKIKLIEVGIRQMKDGDRCIECLKSIDALGRIDKYKKLRQDYYNWKSGIETNLFARLKHSDNINDESIETFRKNISSFRVRTDREAVDCWRKNLEELKETSLKTMERFEGENNSYEQDIIHDAADSFNNFCDMALMNINADNLLANARNIKSLNTNKKDLDMKISNTKEEMLGDIESFNKIVDGIMASDVPSSFDPDYSEGGNYRIMQEALEQIKKYRNSLQKEKEQLNSGQVSPMDMARINEERLELARYMKKYLDRKCAHELNECIANAKSTFNLVNSQELQKTLKEVEKCRDAYIDRAELAVKSGYPNYDWCVSGKLQEEFAKYFKYNDQIVGYWKKRLDPSQDFINGKMEESKSRDKILEVISEKCNNKISIYEKRFGSRKERPEGYEKLIKTRKLARDLLVANSMNWTKQAIDEFIKESIGELKIDVEELLKDDHANQELNSITDQNIQPFNNYNISMHEENQRLIAELELENTTLRDRIVWLKKNKGDRNKLLLCKEKCNKNKLKIDLCNSLDDIKNYNDAVKSKVDQIKNNKYIEKFVSENDREDEKNKVDSISKELSKNSIDFCTQRDNLLDIIEKNKIGEEYGLYKQLAPLRKNNEHQMVRDVESKIINGIEHSINQLWNPISIFRKRNKSNPESQVVKDTQEMSELHTDFHNYIIKNPKSDRLLSKVIEKYNVIMEAFESYNKKKNVQIYGKNPESGRTISAPNSAGASSRQEFNYHNPGNLAMNNNF